MRNEVMSSAAALECSSFAGFEFRTDLHQEVAEGVAQLRVLQAEIHGGAEVAALAAAVVTHPFELVTEHLLVFQERRDGVGELDLAAGAASGGLQEFEDTRHEEITPHHPQVRG